MRFKLVGCLSTVFIYCISVNSVAAIDVISKQGSQATQTIASNPLRIIEREQRKREREQRIELQRKEREQLRIQFQQQVEQRQREMSNGNKVPLQGSSNSSAGNRPPRQKTTPFSQQELEYMNSLAPDERQLYEIIHRAKRGIQHQQIAGFMGSGLGITPNRTHQTAQDLDREFQNALRDSRSGKVASTGKPGNQLLQRILKKRSNETPEQWYQRTTFLFFYTSGEYEPWRATLSAAEKQAYDALAQKRRAESMKEVGGALTETIKHELSCRNVEDANGNYVQVCSE